MIDIRQAYNSWAQQYDTNKNRTRDLEARSLRETLDGISIKQCLEIGCGTGKNTEWLVAKAGHIVAVDLSEEMLAKAKEKIGSDRVTFLQTDITKDWTFADRAFDLVTFSLVLEHIENLDAIFEKVAQITAAGAYVYVGELHPFKQYTGTKARFDTSEGQQIVTCFDHHISDFTMAASKHGFRILSVNEYFDDGDRSSVPRILTLLFKKSEAA